MIRKARPVIDRLLDKLRTTETGCMEFVGCRVKHGYGKIAVTRSKPAFTHRVAYEHLVGPIPDGLYVLHRCDNPPCCNPEHLFLGSQKDNWIDARTKGRNLPSPQSAPNYRHWRSTQTVNA